MPINKNAFGYVTTGDRLETIYSSVGLSREALAEKMAVSPDTIAIWESNGTKAIPIERIAELADICHMEIQDIASLLFEKLYESDFPTSYLPYDYVALFMGGSEEYPDRLQSWLSDLKGSSSYRQFGKEIQCDATGINGWLNKGKMPRAESLLKIFQHCYSEQDHIFTYAFDFDSSFAIEQNAANAARENQKTAWREH